jgi:hypothetical protein
MLGQALGHHYAHNKHHPEFHSVPAGPDIEALKTDLAWLQAFASQCTDWAASVRLLDIVKRLEVELAARQSRVRQMSLLDILEMLLDWKAASQRHKDGCIWCSVMVNQKRFGYGDELRSIFLNTIREMGLGQPEGCPRCQETGASVFLSERRAEHECGAA